MNKKIFLFLLMALPALILQSCLKDQEDTFDKSASARMSDYLNNASQVLTGAANGWVLDYYPDRNQSFGGYSYTLKFDGQTVEIRSELGGYEGMEIFAGTSTCLYKLVADDGPVLTFDTYNDAIHAFATPSPNYYQAYDGDFEFIIMEATPQKVTLKGKRSGNIMYMYPLQRSAEDYMADVIALSTGLPIVGARGNIGTESVNMGITLEGNRLTHEADIEYGDTSFIAPIIVYDKGIRFYKPLEIGGKTIYQLEFDNNAMTLTCTDEGATDVVLTGIMSPTTLLKITGSSMAFDNSANTSTFSVNKLEEYTLTPDVDWIHISTSGNTLTISVDANTSGAPRSGSITVKVGELQDVISVTQIEVTDFLGNYTLNCVDSDNKDYSSPVLIEAVGDGTYNMTFYYPNANYPQTISMIWNEAATRFEYSCGQLTGRIGSYYAFLCFIDADFNYYSSSSTSGTAYFIPSMNSEGKITLSVGGTYGNFAVGGLCLLVGNDTNIANMRGWYEAFMKMSFTKQ